MSQDYFNITKGQKVTTIHVNDMAMSIRREITVVSMDEITPPSGPTRTVLTYIIRGKRKAVASRIDFAKWIFLNGWELDIKVDTDYDCWSGNACYNVVGISIDRIKEIIDGAMFPVSDYAKANMLWTDIKAAGTWQGLNNALEVYPDAPFKHAGIQRMRNRAEQVREGKK